MTEVEAYIIDQPDAQQNILFHLHHLLLSFPQVTSKIRYRIPFYYRKSWICYLNPLKSGGVELVFTRGNELSNEQRLLDFRGRKQVAGLIINQVEDIPELVLLEVVQEALLLDESTPYPSKRTGKKRSS